MTIIHSKYMYIMYDMYVRDEEWFPPGSEIMFFSPPFLICYGPIYCFSHIPPSFYN